MMALPAFWNREGVELLGWALLHSLWQGVVLAALLAVALRLMRARSANARYLLAYLTLLAMVFFPLLTAFRQPRLRSAEAAVAPTARELVLDDPTAPDVATTGKISGMESWLPFLVTFWQVGVLFQAVRLGGGWLVVQRAVRRKRNRRAPHLEALAAPLAAAMGLRRLPRVFESVHVEVPTVIGWFRAVILLPPCAMTGLTPQALEALLAHELAHVRRHDYLFNLAQLVCETLLFYHPATWWIGRQIRMEREHCCDDCAVQTLGDRMRYARALLTLEELRALPSALAMSSRGGDLKGRVQRLFGASPARTFSFTLAGSAPLAVCALVGALSLAQAAIPRAVDSAVASDTLTLLPPASAAAHSEDRLRPAVVKPPARATPSAAVRPMRSHLSIPVSQNAPVLAVVRPTPQKAQAVVTTDSGEEIKVDLKDLTSLKSLSGLKNLDRLQDLDRMLSEVTSKAVEAGMKRGMDKAAREVERSLREASESVEMAKRVTAQAMADLRRAHPQMFEDRAEADKDKHDSDER